MDDSGALTRYTSVNYGRNTTLSLDADGQLEAGNRLMLPSGAYGNGDCRIDTCTITYSGGIFQVRLEVSDRRGTGSEDDIFHPLSQRRAAGYGDGGRGNMTYTRLGDLLVGSGTITQQQLEEALEEQKKSGKRLGTVLVENHIITEKQLIER